MSPDPRLGRWMSPDPYGQFHSPYLAMGNSPISGVDPDGGYCPTCPDSEKWNFFKDSSLDWGYDPENGTAFRTTYLPEMSFESTQLFGGQKGALLGGLSTFANTLYGTKPGSTELLNLSESQKQNDFKTSASKTTAILMAEFATGTGEEVRVFNDGEHALAEDLKWSFSSNRAITEFMKSDAYKNGNIKFYYYASFSPDKVGIGESIGYHLKAAKDQSIWRGGMEYFIERNQNKIIVQIHDTYSIASGISRNESSNNVSGPMRNRKMIVNLEYQLLSTP